MAKAASVRVQFVRGMECYNAGEQAAFAPEVAAQLVKDKIAVCVDPKTGTPVAPPPAAPTDPKPSEADPATTSTATHELNAEDAIALVGTVKSEPELAALWKGEIAHPKTEGGRKTVLQAIRDRLQALKGDG